MCVSLWREDTKGTESRVFGIMGGRGGEGFAAGGRPRGGEAQRDHVQVLMNAVAGLTCAPSQHTRKAAFHKCQIDQEGRTL